MYKHAYINSTKSPPSFSTFKLIEHRKIFVEKEAKEISMEANTKSKRKGGFMKGKLMPNFYKQYNNGSKTKQVGLVGSLFHKDYCISQQNIALLVHENPGRDATATRDSLRQFDDKNLFGIVVDDGVDVKAANYISSTLARFKSSNEIISVEIVPS